MSKYIRVYNKTEIGYQKLNILASYMTELSSDNTLYALENVYYDFGQNWWWTTIVAIRLYDDSYQVLSPKNMEDLQTIPLDENLFFNIYKLAYEIMNGKFSLDKPNRVPQISEL